MLTESNTCFGLVISGMKRGVIWGGGGGVWGLFSSQSQNVSYLWLHVEEEATGNID